MPDIAPRWQSIQDTDDNPFDAPERHVVLKIGGSVNDLNRRIVTLEALNLGQLQAQFNELEQRLRVLEQQRNQPRFVYAGRLTPSGRPIAPNPVRQIDTGFYGPQANPFTVVESRGGIPAQMTYRMTFQHSITGALILSSPDARYLIRNGNEIDLQGGNIDEGVSYLIIGV